MTSTQKTQAGFWHKVLMDFRALGLKHNNPFTFLVYLLICPGFLAVFLFRLSSFLADKTYLGWIAAKLIARLNAFLNGCEIAPKAVIAGGLHLPHPCGIVIGLATIGAKVRILQNVTLGSRHEGDDSHHPSSYPVLCDNVVIGAGAAVIGAITLGEGAQIGANAVVLKDVPARATAVGVPARILSSTEQQA